jgi:SAM-dependent methyltransferase
MEVTAEHTIPTFSSADHWMDPAALTARVEECEGKIAECSAAIQQLCNHNEHRWNEIQHLKSLQDQMARQVLDLQELAAQTRSWLFALQPDVYRPSDEGRRLMAEVLGRHGVDAAQLNIDISKYDVMFQFLAEQFGRKGESIDRALVKYLRSGLHMLQVLEQFVRRKFGSFESLGSMLDFASGYGRLTRFLIRELDPTKIWVSDIKAHSVEFQQSHFGVNGLVSTLEPEDLDAGRQFDLVFVGSLFSHLPEATFERWLRRLWDLLTPTGLLVFSANSADLLEAADRELTFISTSEENSVCTNDRALDPRHYGSTFVTEKYLAALFERLTPRPARYARYVKGLWDRQDVYAIARDGTDMTGLTLPAQI